LQDQWKNYFEQISTDQKKQVLELLTQLLERARATSVSEIAARISIDGDLSSGEKAHLKAIEKLYESRLKRLSASKKVFAKIIGARS
jgi:formate dehydrogenase maturation protein FdhE